MKLPISISARAEQDLAIQYQWYVKHAGADVAERYLAAFDEAIHELAVRPDIGVRRRFESDELQGMRSSPVAGAFHKHLIFYREADSLSIERVMHGARDLPRRLLEEPGIE